MRLSPYPKNNEIAVGNSVGIFYFSSLSQGNYTVVFEENRKTSITRSLCARSAYTSPHISPVARQSALGIIHNPVLEKNHIPNFFLLPSCSVRVRVALLDRGFNHIIP